MAVKKKVLKKAPTKSKSLAALNKQHAADLVDRASYDCVEVIPSGSLIINTLTGIGGYPRGRITELWGEEGVSKTTLALHASAECQKMGLAVVYMDFEGAFSNTYATDLGVNIYDKDKFAYFEPDTFEEGEEILRDYVEAEEVGLIVLDSVSAMTPEGHLEGGHGIGLLARKLSQFLSGFVKALRRGKAACLAVNQIRMKIATSKFERTEECSPGGKALQFYNALKIKLKRRARFKSEVKDFITGKMVERNTKVLVRAEVSKNKFSKPFVVGDYWVKFGEGVDNGGSIFDMSAGRGLFLTAGSWISFLFPWDGKSSGEFKVQGIDNVREMVSNDPELQKACLQAMDLSMSASDIAAEKAVVLCDGEDEDD